MKVHLALLNVKGNCLRKHTKIQKMNSVILFPVYLPTFQNLVAFKLVISTSCIKNVVFNGPCWTSFHDITYFFFGPKSILA